VTRQPRVEFVKPQAARQPEHVCVTLAGSGGQSGIGGEDPAAYEFNGLLP